MVHLARLASLDHEARLHPQTLAHELVMDRRAGEQRGLEGGLESVLATAQQDGAEVVEIAPELEEVVLDADVVTLEHRLPDGQ